MDASKVEQLREFVEQCESNPSLLSDPSLSFFRDYIESLGGEIPSPGRDYKSKSHVVDESDEDMDDIEDEEAQVPEEEEEEEEPEIVESDIELDESGVVQ
ncbi:hypothetical protein MIMGU_mgv1a0074362mg, partial [Erythranthe guttata]